MSSVLPPPRLVGGDVPAMPRPTPTPGGSGEEPKPWVVGAPAGVERRWRERGSSGASGDAPVEVVPPGLGDELADEELTDKHELVELVEGRRTVGESAAGSSAVTRDPTIPEEVIEEQERIAELHDVTPVDALALRRRRNRLIRRVAFGVVALLVGYYLVTLWQVWSTGRADEVEPVDAIVVMGAAQYDGRPSPQLAARLDHVVELWPQDLAPLVVVTGGNLPGDRFTEAEASAAYLVEQGVPESAILMEDEGSNTYESLGGVAAMLDGPDANDVLIVTDPYHALRSRLVAEEVGLDARVSSTDSSVVTGGANLRRHLQEAAGISIGRIIGFDRLTALTD